MNISLESLLYIAWGFGLFIGVLLFCSACLNMFFIFRYVWHRDSILRRACINTGLILATVVLIFIVLETSFGLFGARSDGFNFTLASKLWNRRYWKPINRLGYRDETHDPVSVKGKKVLIVVGDSFAAGYGINDYKNRFSNILQSRLGDDWVVANVAKNGWDTVDEYKAITSYPYKPKAVVLSYFVNDIDGTARRRGFEFDTHIAGPAGWLQPFVSCSHFFNFMYWRLYRLHNVDIEQYNKKILSRFYMDDQVWRAHRDELLDIINYCKNNKIGLIVVVFPTLSDVSNSRESTAKVADFLISQNVPVLDLTARFEKRKAKDLVVNPQDAHPNINVHREVGELLTSEVVKIAK